MQSEGTSFTGARELLEAVDQEFRGYGMVLQGAAGELISTSGKWPSNIQRDMLRRCKAAKVAYMQKHTCTSSSCCVVCKFSRTKHVTINTVAVESEVPVKKLDVPVIINGVLKKRFLVSLGIKCCRPV